MKFFKSINSCFFLITFMLVSCSSGIQVQELPSTANVADEFQSLEADLRFSAANQANVLSPNNFKQAEKFLNESKESFEKQKDPKDTLHKIATGRAYLKRANEVENLANTNMEEVVIARQKAIAAGAATFFVADFRIADNQLREVTSDLEKNNYQSMQKNRTALQSSYMNLELRGVKQASLGYAQKIIAQAINENARKFAPQTLSVAEKNLKDTEAFINANRNDSAEIKTRTALLNQSADHLLNITHAAIKTKKVSPEDLALQMDKKQNALLDEKKVTSSLNQENAGLHNEITEKKNDLMVEQSVSESLAAENKSLEDKIDIKKKDLTAEQTASAALWNEKQTLESEKISNDKFENARKEFSKNEAEVYKQGNSLTIRLRGLKFGSSKADLKGASFPLLGKVQKVIKDFEGSEVVVEGHTDSLGAKTINNKISQDRAQAVREYFISNGIIPEEKIQAIGLGEKKPLATNKTAAGRAENRRVDVIIRIDDAQKL